MALLNVERELNESWCSAPVVSVRLRRSERSTETAQSRPRTKPWQRELRLKCVDAALPALLHATPQRSLTMVVGGTLLSSSVRKMQLLWSFWLCCTIFYTEN